LSALRPRTRRGSANLGTSGGRATGGVGCARPTRHYQQEGQRSKFCRIAQFWWKDPIRKRQLHHSGADQLEDNRRHAS
jgi:hypothetical protein